MNTNNQMEIVPNSTIQDILAIPSRMHLIIKSETWAYTAPVEQVEARDETIALGFIAWQACKQWKYWHASKSTNAKQALINFCKTSQEKHFIKVIKPVFFRTSGEFIKWI